MNQISSLPRVCPFVVEVDYDVEWCSEASVMLKQWRYIIDFRSLRFDGLEAISLDSLGSQITTSITSIILRTTNYGRNLNISLYDLETVHRTLPHLRSLALHHVEVKGEMLEDITPCDTMQDLSLEAIRGGLWGHYFARKYTTRNYSSRLRIQSEMMKQL
ncbi:hypothetical protein DFQ30_007247 [Apophysomyces sp. BC1015]|nr:hypothetical protein DFQ30_007247 [Apophysomyces sp. BC1015]